MKRLKKQRCTLIILLTLSLTLHLVYGLEGQAQMSKLKSEKGVLVKENNNLNLRIYHLNEEIESYKFWDKLEKEHIEKLESKAKKEKYVEEEYTITAYCLCEKCCGKYALNRPNGVVYGASGIELQEGVSVASPLPFGTKIIIDGHEYISQDRTSEWIAKKYDNKIIDVYFDEHEDAVKFGKRIAKVYIVEGVKDGI